MRSPGEEEEALFHLATMSLSRRSCCCKAKALRPSRLREHRGGGLAPARMKTEDGKRGRQRMRWDQNSMNLSETQGNSGANATGKIFTEVVRPPASFSFYCPPPPSHPCSKLMLLVTTTAASFASSLVFSIFFFFFLLLLLLLLLPCLHFCGCLLFLLIPNFFFAFLSICP